jgi:hypothetical protein
VASLGSYVALGRRAVRPCSTSLNEQVRTHRFHGEVLVPQPRRGLGDARRSGTGYLIGGCWLKGPTAPGQGGSAVSWIGRTRGFCSRNRARNDAGVTDQRRIQGMFDRACQASFAFAFASPGWPIASLRQQVALRSHLQARVPSPCEGHHGYFHFIFVRTAQNAGNRVTNTRGAIKGTIARCLHIRGVWPCQGDLDLQRRNAASIGCALPRTNPMGN